MGIKPDNIMPLCVRNPVASVMVSGKMIPPCPDTWLNMKDPNGKPRYQFHWLQNTPSGYIFPDVERWATRGAINAGLAVFLFLEELEGGGVAVKPPFNQCEKLPRSMSPP